MAQFTTSYSGLVSLITDYVEDESTELAGMIQGAINRAEERIYRDLDLVLWNTAIEGQTSADNGVIAKPYSGTHLHTFLLNLSGDYCQRRSIDYIYMLAPNRTVGTGPPEYYHEDENNIYLSPIPNQQYSYTIIYSKRPNRLTPSNDQNWFTLNAADALLYASLVEAEAFLVAPERVQEWEGKYQQQLGPLRGIWRHVAQRSYEPVDPTPTPATTR